MLKIGFKAVITNPAKVKHRQGAVIHVFLISIHSIMLKNFENMQYI